MLIRTNQCGLSCALNLHCVLPKHLSVLLGKSKHFTKKTSLLLTEMCLEMCHDIKIVVWVNATKKVPLGVVIRPSKKFFLCLFSIIAHDPC